MTADHLHVHTMGGGASGTCLHLPAEVAAPYLGWWLAGSPGCGLPAQRAGRCMPCVHRAPGCVLYVRALWSPIILFDLSLRCHRDVHRPVGWGLL